MLVVQSQEKRIIEIRNVVDQFLRRLVEWAQEKSINVMPDRVANQLKDTATILGQSEAPESCRSVATAVSRVAEEFRGYEQREHGKVRPESGSPGGGFWAACIELANCRSGIDEPLVEVLEPVCLLLKQGVSHEQIARHIYGRNGVGPFMQASGVPNVSAIEKESAQPGSVLGENWVPPWHQERIDREKSKLAEMIKVMSRHRDNRRYDDPGTVESMLRDGCFVQQIEQGKGVTRAEVLKVAREIGVEAKDGPGYRPQAGLTDGLDDDDLAGDDGYSDSEPDSKATQAQNLKQEVLTLHEQNPEMGSAEIAGEMRKRGYSDVNTNKVSAIIGHEKKRLAKLQSQGNDQGQSQELQEMVSA